jgi:hypothetical protein
VRRVEKILGSHAHSFFERGDVKIGSIGDSEIFPFFPFVQSTGADGKGGFSSFAGHAFFP